MGVTGTDQMRADFPGGWAEDEKSAFTAEGRTPEQNESWNFASTLLNWRRTSKAVAEGKLIHYTPDNRTKCYVYARTNGEETVLVILNGHDGKMYKTEVAAFIEKFTKYDDSFGDLPDEEKPDIIITLLTSKAGNKYVGFDLIEA